MSEATGFLSRGLSDPVNVPLRVAAANFGRTQMRRLRNVQRLESVSSMVYEWLAPISVFEPFLRYPRTAAEAHATFQQIAKGLAAAVPGNPRFEQFHQEIAKFVSQPIQDLHLVIGQHWRRENYTPLKTYLAVIYARALHFLRDPVFTKPEGAAEIERRLTGDMADSAVLHLRSRLHKLGPRFLGHLVMEADCRAAEDPDFAQRLDSAIQAFEEHVGAEKRTVWMGPQAEQLSVLAAPENRDLSAQAHIAFILSLWE